MYIVTKCHIMCLVTSSKLSDICVVKYIILEDFRIEKLEQQSCECLCLSVFVPDFHDVGPVNRWDQ